MPATRAWTPRGTRFCISIALPRTALAREATTSRSCQPAERVVRYHSETASRLLTKLWPSNDESIDRFEASCEARMVPAQRSKAKPSMQTRSALVMNCRLHCWTYNGCSLQLAESRRGQTVVLPDSNCGDLRPTARALRCTSSSRSLPLRLRRVAYQSRSHPRTSLPRTFLRKNASLAAAASGGAAEHDAFLLDQSLRRGVVGVRGHGCCSGESEKRGVRTKRGLSSSNEKQLTSSRWIVGQDVRARWDGLGRRQGADSTRAS